MGTDLKKIRVATDFTQTQVAERADITVMSYSRYESGKREPRVRTAIRIAQALGSTVEDLFPLPTTATNGIEKQPDGNRA